MGHCHQLYASHSKMLAAKAFTRETHRACTKQMCEIIWMVMRALIGATFVALSLRLKLLV